MSETITKKHFILGLCNCDCNEKIPIRSKKGILQRFKHGHHNLELFKFYKGRNHSHYKGGYTMKGGYIAIYRPYHPNSREGYILFHRYEKELELGRYLTKEEEIHHIDGNKFNNDPSNLQILTKQTHTSISRTKGDIPVKDRYCNSCKGKTYVDKNGWEYWHYNPNGYYICHNCHQRLKRLAKV